MMNPLKLSIIIIYGAAFCAHPPRWVQPIARRYYRQTGDTIAQIIGNANPKLLADTASIARECLRQRLNDALCWPQS